jgi:SAM-dependent methyltransferase
MTTRTASAELSPDEVAGALAARLFEAGLGAFELLTVALGERLGLYRALADRGPITPAELAAAARTDARYTREWCEQQAAAGLVTVHDPDRAVAERHFALPPGSEAVLLDPQSPGYLVPFADFLEAVCRVLPALQSAFRSGKGVPYADYAVQHAQGAVNRPAFAGQLVQEWLPRVPDLHARLLAGGTVAELGCGEGWAAIALAVGYPNLIVEAFDIDPPSIEAARSHAEVAGVADRTAFGVADITDLSTAGGYDAVFAFEVIHDLADPVAALRTARRLTDEGRMPTIVMDERAAETFSAPADPIERFLYAVSVLHCLPAGRAAPGSVATGTVLRPDLLRRYAGAAGFAQVSVLPIDNDMFRFYRLGG